LRSFKNSFDLCKSIVVLFCLVFSSGLGSFSFSFSFSFSLPSSSEESNPKLTEEEDSFKGVSSHD